MSTHSVDRWWLVTWGLEEYREFGMEEAAEDFAHTLRLNNAWKVEVRAAADEVHTFPTSNQEHSPANVLADSYPPPEDVERARELARERGWKDIGGQGVVEDPAKEPDA